MKNNVVLIGIAGSIAIIFFDIITGGIGRLVGESMNVVILTTLSTFSVYVLSFKIANFLDYKCFWKLYQPILIGEWELKLTNLATSDNDRLTGKVTIKQTRDLILISAINYNGENRQLSTWKSIDAVSKPNELFFTYESESSIEDRPIKRGHMKFMILQKKPTTLEGNYYDTAPSKAKGPIVLTKVQNHNNKQENRE